MVLTDKSAGIVPEYALKTALNLPARRPIQWQKAAIAEIVRTPAEFTQDDDYVAIFGFNMAQSAGSG